MNNNCLERDFRDILKQEYCEGADTIRKAMVLASFSRTSPIMVEVP